MTTTSSRPFTRRELLLFWVIAPLAVTAPLWALL
jgi:hypothetical protein